MKILRQLKRVFTIIVYLICILFATFLFNQIITGCLGLEVGIFGSIFLAFSIITFLIPIGRDILGVHKYCRGVVLWFLLMLLTFTSIIIYHAIRNITKDVLVAEYFWESSIELHLRKNGTYRVFNTDWVTGYSYYGKYKIEGNNIIMLKKLKFGGSNIKDTLKYDYRGIHFKLDKEWKSINSGVMKIKKNELFKN